MSKQFNKVLSTIETLSTKEVRTNFQSVRLANAQHKKDKVGLSRIHKDLMNAEGDMAKWVSEVLGDYEFPTFKQFATKTSIFKDENKDRFSVYDGLRMLSKFNKKAEHAKKAAKQQKREAKKTMEVVNKAA
jgi:hypothetical protein